MAVVPRINDFEKGTATMKKANVWDLVTKEANVIIKGIEKGEFKTHKEYCDYLEMIYNWRMSDAIKSIINIYIGVNNIEIPWDIETEQEFE